MNAQDFLSLPKEFVIAFSVGLVVTFFVYLWLKWDEGFNLLLILSYSEIEKVNEKQSKNIAEKKTLSMCHILAVLLVVLISSFFFLPVFHREWIISPAEEYHGWQFVAIDGSLSFWVFGYGLNHRYVYFKSTNGTTFPCDDWGWYITPYFYPKGVES